MRAREVRKAFFEYFREKQHTFVAPSPVVPRNDPTILFINAGMNQFKNIFMGEENTLFPRAVNSQLCILRVLYINIKYQIFILRV